MDFLKTLFWIVLSAVIVIFSVYNWTPVSVRLWEGMLADVKLPVLLLIVFLIGFVPTLIYYRTRQWRLTRRLETIDREIADLRGINQFHAPERAASGDELSLDTSAASGTIG